MILMQITKLPTIHTGTTPTQRYWIIGCKLYILCMHLQTVGNWKYKKKDIFIITMTWTSTHQVILATHPGGLPNLYLFAVSSGRRSLKPFNQAYLTSFWTLKDHNNFVLESKPLTFIHTPEFRTIITEYPSYIIIAIRKVWIYQRSIYVSMFLSNILVYISL